MWLQILRLGTFSEDKLSRAFKKLSPLPVYTPNRNKEPVDGILHNTPDFCKKNFNDRCQRFYASSTSEGYHQCPYGYSVRAFVNNGKITFFSGLGMKGHSDVNKLRKGERLPDPLLTRGFIENCIHQFMEQQKVRSDYNSLKKQKGHFEQAIHEVRNFNTQSRAICDELFHLGDPESSERLINTVNGNYAITQMVSSRLNFLTYKLNPSVHAKKPIELFKKIDKSVRLVRPLARTNNIKISFHGDSKRKVDGYSFLEQVPAILVQNAMKYSISGIEVIINIKDSETDVIFSVENVGYYIGEDERDKIFGKGYRGREAKKVQIGGYGLGLSFAHEVVRIHGGNIQLEVGAPLGYNDHRISKIKFTVTLPFRTTV